MKPTLLEYEPLCRAHDGGEMHSAMEYMLLVLNDTLKPNGIKQPSSAMIRLYSEIQITDQVLYSSRGLYDLMYDRSRRVAKEMQEKTKDCSSVNMVEVLFQEDRACPFGGGRIVVVVTATQRMYATVMAVGTPSAPVKEEPQVFVQTGERDL